MGKINAILKTLYISVLAEIQSLNSVTKPRILKITILEDYELLQF